VTRHLELARQIVNRLDRLACFMVITRAGKAMPEGHTKVLTAVGKACTEAARGPLRREQHGEPENSRPIIAEESGVGG
jgi:hypothetical protein